MDTETKDIDVTNIYDINHLKSIIASLKSDLVIANVNVENNRNMRTENTEKHKRDIRLIGEALIEAAEEREWCSQYDDFIEELNTQLSVELPTREKEYDVEVEITQKRTQVVVVTIKARDRDHAIELVSDDPGAYYTDELSEYDWDIEDEEGEVQGARLA